MVKPDVAATLIERLQASQATGEALQMEAVKLLSLLDGYDWCGIYRLEGSELVLGPFYGESTEHVRIRVGEGVCGTAVSEGRNQVIEDVRKLDNYLACSLDTRSEIVVLIRRGSQVVGQIDIDGHSVGAFDESDEKMLEAIADLLAERWS